MQDRTHLLGAPALVVREVGEVRSVALPRVDHFIPLCAALRQHRPTSLPDDLNFVCSYQFLKAQKLF